MATYGWAKDNSVAEWLEAEPQRFDFYQAVALLHLLRPQATAVAEGTQPTNEPVRFKSNPDMKFPASSIERLEARATDEAPEMTVNFMGLAGSQGPLPRPMSSLVYERALRKDTALRDFLDIFHHRLISLRYRIRQRHRVGLDSREPGKDHVARYLLATIGLQTDKLQDRMLVADRALIYYSGLLSAETRSMTGLERLLEDYFAVPVEVRPFVPQWIQLEDHQLTRLGDSGQNNDLGRRTVLGRRYCDLQGKFELRLGALSREQYLDFLPTGQANGPLTELTSFYAGEQYDFDIVLRLKAPEIPASRVSRTGTVRLGWTSWLQTRSEKRSDPEVRLRVQPLPPELKALRIPLFAGLTPDELATVHSRLRGHDFPAGHVIVAQEGLDRSLFIISRGSVRVLQRDAEGVQWELGTIGDGGFFGEMSILTGAPRTATVVTAEECEIFELSQESLNELIATYPNIQNVLIEYAEARQREALRRQHGA